MRPRLALLALVAAIAAGCEREPTASSKEPSSSPDAATTALDLGPVLAAPRRTSQQHPEVRSPIRFRDGTEASGIAFVHRSGNGPEKHYPTANGSGVALLDFDGDGRLDLYLATTRPFPLDAPDPSKGNRLYRNLGDGRFEDVTDDAGATYAGFTHGVLADDLDGDGDPDLYLCNYGANVLLENQGGRFRRVDGHGAEGGGWSSGAGAINYDGDGRLDLYVTSYGRWTLDGPHQYCGDAAREVRIYCPPTSIPPARHFLYRNRGDGTFEDVTERAGVLREDGRGLGVLAADLDADGRTDLYVANDMSPNFLFRNRGDGTFEDLTEASGASSSEAGYLQASMGVDAEDLDGDGRPELFVTNFANDYNTLYRNLGGFQFQDASAWAGIVRDSLPDVGWGCALADLDNDGAPDMFVVNGHVDDNLGQLGRLVAPYAQPAKIWRNRGDGHLDLVRDAGDFFEASHVARGAAFGDLDDDGDLDAVVLRMAARPAVLWNESPRRRWIRLEFEGRGGNRRAIGATVTVRTGGRTIRRLVKGGGSYLSSNDPRLLIGLGDAERIERVEVLWPGGATSTLEGPAPDRMHRVAEPSGAEGAVEP